MGDATTKPHPNPNTPRVRGRSDLTGTTNYREDVGPGWQDAPVLHLASDQRTKAAYRQARRRARRNGVGALQAPPPDGTAARTLLSVLRPADRVEWLGWAHDHTANMGESSTAQGTWWLVSLTTRHLVVASNSQKPDTWSRPRGDWSTRVEGGAVILSWPERPLALWIPGVAESEFSMFVGDVNLNARRPAPTHPVQSASSAKPVNDTALEGPRDPGPLEKALVETPVPSVSTRDESGDGRTVHDWRTAESLGAWHMRQLGFTDVALTRAGADGGIDVESTEAVAQVKFHTSPIGSPAVQQLRGAAHGKDWALFYALSGFTRSATEWAAGAHVALFAFDNEGRVTAVNDAARYLERQAGAVGGFDADQFELEQTYRQLFQAQFDRSTSLFFSVAHRVIEHLQAVGPRDGLLRKTLDVESERVKRDIHYLGTETREADDAIATVERILGAAARLEQELLAAQR